MANMFQERVPSVDALRDAPIRFRYTAPKVRRVLVDSFTASAILAVYDALQEPENKAKLERMVAGTPEQFRRVASFAFERVGVK